MVRAAVLSTRAGESGLVLAVLAVALLVLAIGSGALAASAFGEAASASHLMRGHAALAVAEAGAVRGLVELRHRISVDLDQGLRIAGTEEIAARCAANEGWRIIAAHAGTGWESDDPNRRAVLRLGTPGDPLRLWASASPGADAQTSALSVTLYVRPADNSTPGSNVCVVGPESYAFRFDAFVVASASVGSARRAVCVKTRGNLVSCGRWLASGTPGTTTWDSFPASHAWIVAIVPHPEGGYQASRWPALQPDVLYDPPHWEELAGG